MRKASKIIGINKLKIITVGENPLDITLMTKSVEIGV